MKKNNSGHPLLAGGLAVAYFLSNAVGVYATEGNVWNDRRAALARQRSDSPIVVAQAAPPFVGGTETSLLPSLRSLSQNPRAEAMDPILSSSLPPEARKTLSWLPILASPYGEIRNIHLAGPDAPLVLHIQDAHDVEEAQRNMGGLVQSLLKNGRVRLVGLEGASGPLSLDPFRQLPNKDIARGVLDLALRLGYIGGAELAAFDAPQATLWGIESSKLYAGNLGAFEKGESFKRQNQVWMDRVSQMASAAGQRWYGPALKEFESHRSAYETGSEGLSVWLSFLWLNRSRGDKYPQLARLHGVLIKESALDFKAVERERQSLAEVLARTLPPNALQRLVDQSLNQRLGRLSFADYQRFLDSLCARYSVRMGAYPHLKEYIAYVAEAEGVDHSGVIEELADLELSVEQRLAVSAEEKKTASTRRDLGVLRKLVNHQMTPSEWHAYNRHRPESAIAAKSLADLSGRVLPTGGLQGLPFYEDYSLLALKRNRALAENLLAKMRQGKIQTAVLVAGGFHTEGLTQALKESGASYVVLGPRITKVPEHSQALEAIVRDPLPLEKLLAGDAIHLAAPRLTGSLEGVAGEAPGVQRWAEQGKRALGSLQWAYQYVHSPGVENSSFDALRRAGYLPESITQEVVSLSSEKAVIVRGPRSSGFALMESDPSVPKGDAGVTADPVAVEKMTVDGKVTEFRTYRPEDLKRPSVLVHGARRGVSFLVDAKRALSSVLVWGRERALSLLRGFGTAWENFLESRLGRMLFPTLERQFVVPLGTSGGLGAPAAGRQGRPKKMADIFPNEPTHWSSVQREDLAFVLTQLGEGADSVRFLTAESTDETLVFAMTTPPKTEAEPQVFTVRFTLAGAPLSDGELYSVSNARGPPAVIVSLRPEIFRADNSSLKRHLSTVVQQALSTLPDTPFGQRNLANYNAAKRAVRESQSHRPSWLEKHTPRLKNVSLFSRSMESIFNRTIAEKLQEKFGFDMLRFLSQTNFTGGLGHVTYDYHESLGLDGADVASIFPLWNWIKGVVKHVDGNQLVDGNPPLPFRPDGTRYESFGDMLRDTLSKREDLLLPSYRLPQKAAFWEWVKRGATSYEQDLAWQCRKTLELQGKEIFFDVYAVKAKYSGQPIFNVDAYVMEGDKKIYIFDEVYGDPAHAPWRVVQVLVYSQASQMLINELVRKGYAKPNLVTLDHEVFAQFPDFFLAWQGVKGLLRHMVHAFNHTIFRPGMWNLPEQAAGLLGLDGLHHLGEWGGSAISIARYTNDRAGALTGVAQIHWKILRDKIFAMVRHKVVNRFDLSRPDRGSNTANGVLFEHWQGVEIRRLIDFTKEKLNLPPTIDDETFFETIEQRQFQEELQKFQKRFEMIKTFYSLDLLIFLNNTQPQTQGGGQWLAETLGEVEGMHQGAYTPENIRGFRDRWQYLINRSFAVESTWEEIDHRFGDLKEALLKRPIVSNVRRQVSYKGPDMYRDIFSYDKDSFVQSGVRLIFGGRTFGYGARAVFDDAKSKARGVGSVAFLENYNSEDAPVIFRGSEAGVKLSDEGLEAAATSNSKLVANGGWLIAVHDGASPERLAVLDKRTQTVQLAITYSHDELRAGINSGALEIVNGSLIPFDDYTQSNDGKGAGRKPSRAGLLTCFSDLGQAYKSPERRRTMLYQGIRWSPTANIHRQTQAFLEIEEAIVLNQNDVDLVSQQIMTTPTEGGSSLADQLETLLYKEIPDGFIWRHTHNLTIPYALEGVGHRPGWVGFVEGLRAVKSKYYYQGPYAPMGDEDGQGRWSLEHHVLNETQKNELMGYVSGLLEGLPAFKPLLNRLTEFESSGTNSPSLDERLTETLKALEFVERTVDRVRENLMKRDLDSGAASVRRSVPSMSPVDRETIFQRDYSYHWKIAVSPTDHAHDYPYMDSGPALKDLRDVLRQLLNENSRGPESLKQASYGTRGGYFFTMMGDRWSHIPALRNFIFSLADEVETVKTTGDPDGWDNPATQWKIRRVYAKFLGALDELIEPSAPNTPLEGTAEKQKSIQEVMAQEASSAVTHQNLGPLNRDLLGGSAHPLEFGSITADVNRIRSLVEAERGQARSAQASLSRSLGEWDLTGANGRLSTPAVMRAGKALGQAVRRQEFPPEGASVAVTRQVFTALVSLGEYLEEGASVEEWRAWASVLAQGFNENIFEVQERVLASIESGRRLGIEVSETMLSGNLTDEDKTRLEELNVLAAHAEELKNGKLTWILPEGTKSLDALWSRYPQLAPLIHIPTQHVMKIHYLGVDGKYSVKNLLLDSQNQKQVESLDPADLYLINRSEWILESDLRKDVARILISLAGNLIYDATEKIGDAMKSLFFLRTNA